MRPAHQALYRQRTDSSFAGLRVSGDIVTVVKVAVLNVIYTRSRKGGREWWILAQSSPWRWVSSLLS